MWLSQGQFIGTGFGAEIILNFQTWYLLRTTNISNVRDVGSDHWRFPPSLCKYCYFPPSIECLPSAKSMIILSLEHIFVWFFLFIDVFLSKIALYMLLCHRFWQNQINIFPGASEWVIAVQRVIIFDKTAWFIAIKPTSILIYRWRYHPQIKLSKYSTQRSAWVLSRHVGDVWSFEITTC